MPKFSTKTLSPQVPPFAIQRRNLIQALKNSANKRLIVILAPGGWGKSTLLGSYIQTLTHPHVWYNIGSDDQDPGAFLSNLAIGIFQMLPQAEKALLPSLMAIRQGGGDPATFLRLLLNAILSHPSQKFMFIFDDYHLAGISPRFNQAFHQLIERAPLNLHVIIATRKELPFSLSKFSSSDELTNIKTEQLRFDQEEIRLFFQQNYAVDLFQHDLERIDKQTDGWPVGLRLSGEGLAAKQRNDPNASPADQKIEAEMADRFFQEHLFSDLPENIQGFLTQASIFETFNPTLCEGILGWTDAHDKIEQMARQGLFIIKLDPQNHLYRFHHLFRQFLLKHLADDKDQAAIIKLHSDAAVYYTQKEQWREAASHYIKSKQYKQAATILRQTIRDFISTGSAESLLRVLEQIPSDVLDDDPALLYAKGWAQFLLTYLTDARKTLQMAKQQSLATNDMVFYGHIVQLLMFLHFSLDDFKTNEKLANESRQYLPADTRETVLIDTQLAISLMHLGRPMQAETVWQQVKNHTLIGQDTHLFMESVPLMALNYHYILGEFEVALNLTDKAINHFRTANYMGRLGRHLFFKGLIKYEVGEFDRAQQLLEEAAREILRTGDKSTLYVALSFSAVNTLSANNPENAKKLINAAERIFSEAPDQTIWKEHTLHLAKAMDAHHRGHPDDFFSNAKKAIHLIDQKNIWLDRYTASCLFVLPYLQFGRTDIAVNLMEKVLTDMSSLKTSYPMARSQLLMAAIQNAQGDTDKALVHLSIALDISKSQNFDFLFLRKEKEVARQLLPLALSHRLHLSFVSFLLVQLNNNSGLPILPLLENDDPDLKVKTIRTISDLGCRDVESRLSALTKDKNKQVRQQAEAAVQRIQALDPLPLHVKTLGRFQLTQGKTEVPNTVWRRKLAKSIAKFFIVHPDQEFTSDQLMDTFLPRTHPEEGRQLLNQAVTVIRRALEPGIAPKRESAYLKLQHSVYRLWLPTDSTVDLFEFERLCEGAAVAKGELDHHLSLSSYAKALDIYQGDFLPEDLYQDWTAPIRERIKAMYARALYSTAEAYYQQLEFDRCIHQLQLLIQNEPWDEKAYLLQMKCHFALGDRPRLIKTFRRCKDVLDLELGIAPGEALLQLYNQITN